MSKKDIKIPFMVQKLFPRFSSKYKYYVEAYEVRGSLIKDLKRNEVYYKDKCDFLDVISSIVNEDGTILSIDDIDSKKVVVYNQDKKFDVYVQKVFGGHGVRVVDLYATYYECKNHIVIDDIQISGNDRDKGYGSDAMKQFLKRAKAFKVKSISGEITKDDYLDHGSRLVHFYEKFGFEVTINPNKSGQIYKLL
jgi:ribosomal protein S18 acetylase RimI-like enzyme